MSWGWGFAGYSSIFLIMMMLVSTSTAPTIAEYSFSTGHDLFMSRYARFLSHGRTVDKFGNLWFTWAEPVGAYATFYDGKAWARPYQITNSKFGGRSSIESIHDENLIRAAKVLSDGSGNVWFVWATPDFFGVRSYNGIKWSEEYHTSKEFSRRDIMVATTIDPWGHIWVGWKGHMIGAQRFNGTVWSEVYYINSDLKYSQVSEGPILLSWGTNGLWAFWTEYRYPGPDLLVLAKFFDGVSWSEETILRKFRTPFLPELPFNTETSQRGTDFGFIHAICDGTGNVWVFWLEDWVSGSHPRILHAKRYNGTTWSERFVVNEQTSTQVTVVSDVFGMLWVFWEEYVSESKPAYIRSSYWNGNSWSAPMHVAKQPLVDYNGGSRYARMISLIDKFNTPWVIWVDKATPWALQASYYDATKAIWANPEVVADSTVVNATKPNILYFDIKFDKFENLWLLWVSQQKFKTDTKQQRHIHGLLTGFNGSTWSESFVLYQYKDEWFTFQIFEYPISAVNSVLLVSTLSTVEFYLWKRRRVIIFPTKDE